MVKLLQLPNWRLFYRKACLACLIELIYVFVYSIVNGKSMERWSEKDSSYLSPFDNGNYGNGSYLYVNSQ